MFKYIAVILCVIVAMSFAAPAPGPNPNPNPQFYGASPYAYSGYGGYSSPYVVSPYSLSYGGLGGYGYGYPYTLF